jgi:hypothetical protein
MTVEREFVQKPTDGQKIITQERRLQRSPKEPDLLVSTPDLSWFGLPKSSNVAQKTGVLRLTAKPVLGAEQTKQISFFLY